MGKYRRRQPVEERIDYTNIPEICYWTKRWEISAQQLFEAMRSTNSNSIQRIREYLKGKGFAL